MEQKVSERLELTFAGVKMRSPIGVSAIVMPWGERSHCTPELHAEILLKHAQAGAGFINAPACSYITREMLDELQKRARPARYAEYQGTRSMKMEEPGEGIYHLSAPFIGSPSPERCLATFPLLAKTIEVLKKKLPPNVPIIASVVPLGDFAETAVVPAKKLEELGVDLIEVNVGCAFPECLAESVKYYSEKDFPLLYVGALVGDHPDIVERIVTEVIKAVNVPVGVKLTPETGFPRVVGLVRRLRDAGAKYVESFNFGATIVPPDIYNRGRSRWQYVDANPFVAGSGSWLRPLLYKHVAGIAKFAPGIDIAASGGLMTPEHVVEVMMLGAKTAELCSGVLLRGRELLRRSIKFLEVFMAEQGYQKVEDLVGLGVPYIKGLDEVDVSAGKVVAEVDPEKCEGSGRCIDNICIALDWEGAKAKVRAEMCEGCGFCVMACPNGAIRLKSVI